MEAEFSLTGKPASRAETGTDNPRAVMLHSMNDAIDEVAKSGIHFLNDELQKFATTMSIAGAKLFGQLLRTRVASDESPTI